MGLPVTKTNWRRFRMVMLVMAPLWLVLVTTAPWAAVAFLGGFATATLALTFIAGEWP